MVNILRHFPSPGNICCGDFAIHSISQDTPNVLDTAEAADQFGAALAPGNFNGDGFTDLAVAVPGERLTFGGVPVRGAVHVFQSTASVDNW